MGRSHEGNKEAMQWLIREDMVGGRKEGRRDQERNKTSWGEEGKGEVTLGGERRKGKHGEGKGGRKDDVQRIVKEERHAGRRPGENILMDARKMDATTNASYSEM